MKDKARVFIIYLPKETFMIKSQIYRDMGMVRLKHCVYVKLVYDLRKGRPRGIYTSDLPTTI